MGLESMISLVAPTEGLISEDDGSSIINFDRLSTDTRFLENNYFTLFPTEPIQV